MAATAVRQPLRFTDEQIRQANSVSLVELARKYGIELENSERKAFHAKHSGGLYFYKNNNVFHHFGNNQTGGAISFIMMMEHLTFVEAVKQLLGSDYTPTTVFEYKAALDIKPGLELPERAQNCRRVFWYLTSIRGIEPEIVSQLMHEKKIYQQDKFGNCVFVGYDEENQPKYCALRGTYPENPYKQDRTGSDKSYSFHIAGSSQKVYVNEAPIDCMSHASLAKLHGIDWKQDHRISLGCLSDNALDRFLNWYDIREITFALDNDTEGRKPDGTPCNWGQEAAYKYALKYREMGYKVAIHTPKTKDFNEDLLCFRAGQREVRKEAEKDNEEDLRL